MFGHFSRDCPTNGMGSGPGGWGGHGRGAGAGSRGRGAGGRGRGGSSSFNGGGNWSGGGGGYNIGSFGTSGSGGVDTSAYGGYGDGGMAGTGTGGGGRDDPPLPQDWVMATDEQTGRTYFYHIPSKTSQWEKPDWSQQRDPNRGGNGVGAGGYGPVGAGHSTGGGPEREQRGGYANRPRPY